MMSLETERECARLLAMLTASGSSKVPDCAEAENCSKQDGISTIKSVWYSGVQNIC